MNSNQITIIENSPSFALLSSDGFVVTENITEKELFDLISQRIDPDLPFDVQVWNENEGKWVNIT